jgi:hypothetical protein
MTDPHDRGDEQRAGLNLAFATVSVTRESATRARAYGDARRIRRAYELSGYFSRQEPFSPWRLWSGFRA